MFNTQLNWVLMACAVQTHNETEQDEVHGVSARRESCFRFHFSHQVSARTVSTSSQTLAFKGYCGRTDTNTGQQFNDSEGELSQIPTRT